MPEDPQNQPPSAGSAGSDGSDETRRRRLRPSGGYRTLRSYQVATLIYDGTVSFCDRFVDKRSRKHDQMVQAARSGGQKIAGGNRVAAAQSPKKVWMGKVGRARPLGILMYFDDLF